MVRTFKFAEARDVKWFDRWQVDYEFVTLGFVALFCGDTLVCTGSLDVVERLCETLRNAQERARTRVT